MKKTKQILLERFNLRELSPKAIHELDFLEEEVKELKKSDREILEMYKPTDMARVIEKKLSEEQENAVKFSPTEEKSEENPFRKQRGRLQSIGLYSSAAAVVLALGLLLPNFMGSNRVTENNGIRIKGGSSLELTIYRNIGEAAEELTVDSVARERDLLQLAYVAPPASYGVILSVDGRGVVTNHLLGEDGFSSSLEPGGEQLLPFSYALDDAPNFETFYILVSHESFEVEALINLIGQEAQKGDAILDIPTLVHSSEIKSTIPGDLDQVALSIRKEK